MLTLKKIEVENFGPFVGRQVIEFPAEGVTVIYGENGRGKTTLLNAIRYAFYGKVLQRGARERTLMTVSNRERAAQGEYDFKVVLTFDFKGETLELTRVSKLRAGVTAPTSDADYEQEVALRVDGRVTGPQERDQLIHQALPDEVSRFFLFDGELLQEYEELLIDESDTGDRISAAIERILGVPVLKRARTHLTALAEAADEEVAKEAKANQRTEKLGTLLTTLSEMRGHQRKELGRLRDELKVFEEERATHEHFLHTQQRAASLLEERGRCEAERLKAQADESDSLEQLRTVMREAWRGLVAARVKEVLKVSQAGAREALDEITEAFRAQALDEGECGICERPLDAGAIARLRAGKTNGTGDPATVLEKVAQSLEQTSNLANFANADRSAEVEQLWKQKERARVDEITARDRINEINELLSDANPDEIRKSRTRYDKLIGNIRDHEVAIEKTEAEIATLDTKISQAKTQIQEASAGAGQVSSATARAERLRATAEIFNEAIENYKVDLRKRVEEDASRFFLQMTTEPTDYKGLQINDSYGLQIIHTDGAFEEARSAGQEHVVALALMAALQRNAPIGGPIVMDSPFGRLDEEHTSKIIGAIPDMATQAVLLVYRAEVDRDAMRKSLGPKLVREYKLDRVSSRHTNIDTVGASDG